MARVTTPRWSTLERWSPTLFVVGGCLLVGHAAVLGMQAFSNLTVPPDVVGPAGHLVALLGLLGLSPALVERAPGTARVAGVVTAVALVGWVLLAVTRLLAVAGLVSPRSEVLPGAVFGLVFVSTVLAYGLFGAATLREGERSTLVGALVLAPAALLVVALVLSAVSAVSDAVGVVVAVGLAASVLALGRALRTRDEPVDRDVPASDVTTG